MTFSESLVNNREQHEDEASIQREASSEICREKDKQSIEQNYKLLCNKKILFAALDVFSDGILISDNKGKIVYVNSAYEAITGLKKEQILGKYLETLLAENFFNIAVSLVVLEEGEAISTLHKYVTGKSALTTASPIRDENGQIIGVINNTRNISELVTLRNELMESKKLTEKYSDELQQLRQVQTQCKEFVFKSKIIGDMLQFASKAASFDSTILIHGESGTGKEVLAKIIHQQSSRKDGPFIKVNCAAIPNELFESELFGYESGAFTGATRKGKPGMFELANEGTILLDEVGELPISVQSKLLRVIQEREVFRIGGSKGIKLNVRIISATNKNLSEEVKKGNFREDLFFRLNVIPITIPPLKERKEDIPSLISHFLEDLNRKYHKNVTIDSEAVEAMTKYPWPGNVRELQNLIEYLFIINSDSEIGVEQLPPKLLVEHIIIESEKINVPKKLNYLTDLFEKNLILTTLRKYPTMRKTAQVLGIDASTLSRKMQKYEIKKYR